GWIWIPRNEWGPGWVDWRRGGTHIGWCPLPPDEILVEVEERPQEWIFVRDRDFVAPRIVDVILPSREYDLFISETVVGNRTIVEERERIAINPGIEPAFIAAAVGRPLVPVEVRPPVLAGTVGVSNAVEVRATERQRVQVSVTEKRQASIQPAQNIPPPTPLRAGEKGRLGEHPPTAAREPGTAAPGPARQPQPPRPPSETRREQPGAPGAAQRPQPPGAPSTAQQPPRPGAPWTAQQPRPGAPSTAQERRPPGGPDQRRPSAERRPGAAPEQRGQAPTQPGRESRGQQLPKAEGRPEQRGAIVPRERGGGPEQGRAEERRGPPPQAEQRRGPSPQERGGRAGERRGPPPQAEQRRGPSPQERGGRAEERRAPPPQAEQRRGPEERRAPPPQTEQHPSPSPA